MRKPRTLATMFFVPIVIGALGLFQFAERAGFANFRNVDLVLLFACGMCFGVALAGYSIHVDVRNLAFLAPMLIGAVGLFGFAQRPGFAAFRSADIVLLCGCGMCFGVAATALVTYLRPPAQRSAIAASRLTCCSSLKWRWCACFVAFPSKNI